MLSPLLPETAMLMEGAREMSTVHQTPTLSHCVNVRLCPCPFHSRLTAAKQTSGGIQECAGGHLQPPPSLSLAPYPPCSHHLSEPPFTHLLPPPCLIFQGSQSPKEKQTPWAAAGSNSSPAVPVMRIPLQRKAHKEKGKEKGGL